MGERKNVWNFGGLGKEYNTYINSKFRIDNLLNIANRESSDQISLLKMLLRTAKKMKQDKLKKMIGLCDENKLKDALNSALKIIKEAINTTGQGVQKLSSFVSFILNKDINKACGMAGDADIELKEYSKLENKKKRGTYFIDDYVQIISSSAFRRLQDKAQVYSLEKNDFIRSRLTHSNEVAAISEAIASLIDFKKLFGEDIYYDCCTIARCSGLIHDIGNPPFGHYGEDVIKRFFSEKIRKKELKLANGKKNDFLKFDGNAQSLRIASKLQYFGDKKSLYLSAGILGAIIKYPFSSKFRYGKKKVKDKFGYFQSEKDIVDGLDCAGTFVETIRNPMALILEAADDISYLTADLEDAIHKGIITKNSFKKFKYADDTDETRLFYESIKEIYNSKMDKFLDIKKEAETGKIKMPNKCTSASEEKRIFEISMRPIISKLRSNLIRACAEQFEKDADIIINQGIMIKERTDAYELLGHVEKYEKLVQGIRDIMKNVYSTSEVVYSEVQGDKILQVILEEYFQAIKAMKIENGILVWENNVKESYYSRIMSYVSKDFIEVYLDEINKNPQDEEYYKMHLLTDFVSGMTDNYAVSIYNLLNGTK